MYLYCTVGPPLAIRRPTATIAPSCSPSCGTPSPGWSPPTTSRSRGSPAETGSGPRRRTWVRLGMTHGEARQEEELGCKDWYVIWRTWQNHLCPVLSKDPSPKELVRFLNSHMTPAYYNGMVMFRPLSRQCSYCSVKFGAIMKMETFRRDLKAISDGLGLGLQASVHMYQLMWTLFRVPISCLNRLVDFYWKLKTFVLGCYVK